MIYVIDDDASVRKALQRLLKSAEMPVQTFASSQEFLASVHPGEADCLIVDVHCPGITGLELQQRLLQTGVRTAVIFTIGLDDEKIRNKARQAGPTGLFLKPIDGQALLDTIRFALNQTHP